MDMSIQPHYVRLKRYILDGITRGTWPPNARLPSEGELTRQFGISRMTANRALRELVAEGAITRIQGVGSFVAGPKAESAMIAVKNVREEIAERGQRHRCIVKTAEAILADATLAASFSVPVGSTLYHTVLLHFADDEPLQLEDRVVNPFIVPRYLQTDFTRVTPHEVLMQSAPLERAEHLIEAAVPTPELIADLCLGEKEPVLVLRRRTFSRGRAVSVARMVYAASRFRFTGTFTGSLGAHASGLAAIPAQNAVSSESDS